MKALWFAVALAACAGDVEVDTGVDAGAQLDAGDVDAQLDAQLDAAALDAPVNVPDAGTPDAYVFGPPDAWYCESTESCPGNWVCDCNGVCVERADCEAP